MCLCEIELTRTLTRWQVGSSSTDCSSKFGKKIGMYLIFYPWQWPKHSSKKEKKTEAQYHAFTWFFLHINAPDSCNLLSVCSHTRIMTPCGGCLSLPELLSAHTKKYDSTIQVSVLLWSVRREANFSTLDGVSSRPGQTPRHPGGRRTAGTGNPPCTSAYHRYRRTLGRTVHQQVWSLTQFYAVSWPQILLMVS